MPPSNSEHGREAIQLAPQNINIKLRPSGFSLLVSHMEHSISGGLTLMRGSAEIMLSGRKE